MKGARRGSRNRPGGHPRFRAWAGRTVMVTHANGSSGYIPDDAAFEQVSYEIESSRLKPGCAENAIVKGFVSLIAQRP